MTRTASRRPSPKRPASKPRRRPQPKRTPRATLFDHAVAAVPGGEITVRRVAAWSITAIVVAITLAVASWMGWLAVVGVAMGEAVGEAGLRVEKLDIVGQKRLDREAVYRAAFDIGDTDSGDARKPLAMPLVDLEAVRQRLMANSWVADASVLRRLPDTLVIRITERTPAAVWQNDGQLMLIDADGKLLEPVSADAMPDLPVLVGQGAAGEAASFKALMAAAPGLQPNIHGATYVGDRRWTLSFESGESLLLPAGVAEAKQALARFVRYNRDINLFDKGYQRFDMRVAGRLVIKRRDGSLVEKAAEPETATTGQNETQAGEE